MGKELFEISSIDKHDTDVLEFSHNSNGSHEKHLLINSRAKSLCSELVDKIEPNMHVDFCTAGELSIFQLVQYALTVTGPADLYLSTWTIKEDPARSLIQLKEKGTIKNLYGIFDQRIKTLDAGHFHLIETGMTKFALTKNHAKVVVIEGKELSLCIVSSANFSNNPRIEAGFISTINSTVKFHKQWMKQVLAGKTIY